MRLMSLVIVLAIAGCAAVTPLPPDVNVQAPAAGVPREITAFSGEWTGSWGGGVLDSTLVVEQIQGREAIIIYSFGTAPRWGINRPGFERVRGTFASGNVLRATLSNGANISYTMNPDGTVNGQYEIRGAVTLGQFRRHNR